MPRPQKLIPKVSFFLAGALVGMRLCARRVESGSNRAKARAAGEAFRELRRLVESLEARLARQESLCENELKRLEELTARVAETPSTPEIVTAVERLLARTVSGLDDRLSAQAHSIDVLKSTVSQTDILLERVLESIDSLALEGEPALVISQPALDNPPA